MSPWRQALESRITRDWYRGAAWLWLLWPLSLLVSWVVARRRRLFLEQTDHGLPVSVVVVGGITVGGTGKTPVVIALVRFFQQRGLKVGVVSRGYGGRDLDKPRLVDARATADCVGDEPLLVALACDCPVAIGRDRVAAVKVLVDSHALGLVISDDGLQHYALPRDFEIAVIDADRGLGNGQLLPMGPLREPATRLQSVDWLLERNGTGEETGFSYRIEKLHQRGTHREYLPDAVAEAWQNCRVAAVTALGQPEQFYRALEGLGLAVERHSFPDHYALTKRDLDGIWGDVIVVTEKDAVKFDAFDDERIWVMTITAELPKALLDTLDARFDLRGQDRCTT